MKDSLATILFLVVSYRTKDSTSMMLHLELPSGTISPVFAAFCVNLCLLQGDYGDRVSMSISTFREGKPEKSVRDPGLRIDILLDNTEEACSKSVCKRPFTNTVIAATKSSVPVHDYHVLEVRHF